MHFLCQMSKLLFDTLINFMKVGEVAFLYSICVIVITKYIYI